MGLDFSKLNQISNTETVQNVQKPLRIDIPEPEQVQHTSTEELRKTALKIIENYHINQEIVAGCKAQILKDIEEKKDPCRTLYAAVEAISRLTGDGDNFFLQVKNKIAEVHQLKG